MEPAHAPGPAIGTRIPRRELSRLLYGAGRYVDDIKLPRMLHLAFVRSPYPHARIKSINVAVARQSAGVEAVLTGADINHMCKPLRGVALHRPGHRAAMQPLMATERAVWQGQTVAAVVAQSRAQAEDAAELVEIDWEELPAIVNAEMAVDRENPAIHPELGDNVAFDFSIDKGDVAQAFKDAAVVVEEEFRFCPSSDNLRQMAV